jgi:hypothetical protein
MRWLSMSADSSIWSRRIEIDWEPLRRLIRERPESVVIGIGVFLRVVVYLTNRSMWLDEMSLKNNLVDKPILDFSQQLTGDQLAPFGFLIVQRAMVRLVGSSNFALRLVPLAMGIAALFLFAGLARRILSRQGALVALVLFAFSDDLIYYSSEMKPYSVDLAVGLAISLVAFDALARPVTIRTVEVLAAAAALAPWCSFASAFIVAGCGATLFLDGLVSGRIRASLIWLILGIGWVANLVVSYLASQTLLSPYTSMYRFWDFAFLPIPPLDQAHLVKAGRILLEIFVNPLNLVALPWTRVGIIAPLLLLSIGALAIAHRSWRTFLLLVLPLVLAMVASGMKRYPLHGRLILELVPAFFLWVAEGTEWIGRMDPTPPRLLYKAVLVLLLAYPCLSTFSEVTGVRPRHFNSHGDLHRNVFID